MKRERPRGHHEPPTRTLCRALDAIEDSEPERAEDLLEEGKDHPRWRRYLGALVALERDQHDTTHRELDELVNGVAEASRIPLDDELRLAAMALKKLGWLERRRENHGLAIGRHATEYGYYLRAGSHEELHDAAVSLDVDHFFAGDLAGSLCWGQTSLKHARRIVDDQTRHRCEATSLNNLAMWHADNGSAERGVELANESLEAWADYEEFAGPDEQKLVWAEYGVGYAWAKLAERGDGELTQEATSKARAAYERARELASERGMSDEAIQPIDDALDVL